MPHDHEKTCGCDEYQRIDRRTLLRRGAAGLAIAALGPIVPGGFLPNAALAAPLTGHKRVVVVNLRGGNDGLNTVIPVGVNRYYDRRPNIAVAPGDALSLAGGPGTAAYMLHPRLTNLQGIWNDGDLAVINGIGYPDANLSHFVSEDIWSYGIRDGLQRSGWIARFAERHADTPMGVVSIGMGARKDFRGGRAKPFVVQSLSRFSLNTDSRYRDHSALRVSKLRALLDLVPALGRGDVVKGAANQALSLMDQVEQAREAYSSEVSYGSNPPSVARNLRDVATLIQGGFDTSLFYTGFGGFDTHGTQSSRHETLLERLDAALGAFCDDLRAMGVYQDTVIVVISEFGRRTFENGSGGTDHGHGNSMLVLGGPIQGGVYGPDVTDAHLEERWLPYEIDFRTVYSQLLERHLGVDPSGVFPEPPTLLASPGLLL